jgi:hypothetical protein
VAIGWQSTTVYDRAPAGLGSRLSQSFRRRVIPDDHRGRRSTYEHSKTAASQPGDEAVGQWSQLQLERMNYRFRCAMERAIASGEEHTPVALAGFCASRQTHRAART